MKVEYKLATKTQASALFLRFYPANCYNSYFIKNEKSAEKESPRERIQELAELFADQVPQHKFSTAELQGYLLNYKRAPEKACTEMSEWVNRELSAKEFATSSAKARRDKARVIDISELRTI